MPVSIIPALWSRTMALMRFIIGLAFVGALSAGTSGCETAKRLAPPGIYKYEDLAKGIPTNATIQQRIDEREALGKADSEAAPKFPVLSQSPSEIPAGLDSDIKAAETFSLLQARDETQTAIAQSRAAVAQEFGVDSDGNVLPRTKDDDDTLRQMIRELEDGVARDQADLVIENQEELPEPLETPEAPAPKEPF